MCLLYMGDKMGPCACKLELGPMASRHFDSPGKSTISILDFPSVTLFLYFGDTEALTCYRSKTLENGEEAALLWRLNDRCCMSNSWEGVNAGP